MAGRKKIAMDGQLKNGAESGRYGTQISMAEGRSAAVARDAGIDFGQNAGGFCQGRQLC